MSKNLTRSKILAALLFAPFLVIASVAWIDGVSVPATPNPLVSSGSPMQNKNTPPKPAPGCSKINDATLIANVKAALAASQVLGGLEITVTAKGGVITITGKTATPEQRKEAGKVSSGVECVKRVVNRLECPSGHKPCGDDCIPRNAPCGMNHK